MRKNKTFFAKPIWEIYVYVKAHGIWLWAFFVIIFLSVRHKRHDIETLQKKRFTECKRQKKQSLQKITEEKIYKRRDFTEEEKTQKRSIFKPTKDEAKADFYKRQKATQFFLHKRESEADFLQKRNWKKKRKTEG